ncbi:MAG: signal peptidase II [Clostridia bacterium]|nr:signal peptidase II [Clostridia bacterium]MBP5273243.1 signal peptidase II [Clostridia bacterium]
MTETNISNKKQWPMLLAWSAVIAGLVGFDQWSKAWVLSKLPAGEAVTVLPNLLQFRFVRNTGAAFSLLSGRTQFLTAVTAIILIIAVLLLFLGRVRDRADQVAVLLLVAGGLGNLIDRVVRHFVVDFIEVLFTNFAVFNFADICVTTGAVLLILSTVWSFGKELRNPQDQE